MREPLGLVFSLKVSIWAFALVIVDKVFTNARQAGIGGAVRRIRARFLVIFRDILFEARVAVAVVVIEVDSSRITMINTMTMWGTLGLLAIIHVDAARMWGDCAIRLAPSGEVGHTSELSIQRITWFAFKVRPLWSMQTSTP